MASAVLAVAGIPLFAAPAAEGTPGEGTPGEVPTDPDSAAFVYHWEVDGTIAGYEYTEHANVNTPVDVHLLDEMIRLPDGSAPVQLLHDYNIRLVDSPVGEWSQEHAYSLLQTMKSIPQRKRDPYGPQDLPRSRLAPYFGACRRRHPC